VDWPTIEILSLDQLLALPQLAGSQQWNPGVYFLWCAQRKLLYVGSSNRVAGRTAGHRCNRVPFEFVTMLCVPYPWHVSVEIAYIEHYAPPLNSNHNSRRAKRPARSPNTAWINGAYKHLERGGS
jgi:hypothetical protein